MTRRPLLILLEFIIITVPLTWWWLNGGLDSYYDVFRRLAFPLLKEMGVNTFNPGLVRDRMISFIPFMGLMLVTPGLSLRRRFGGLLGGLALVFLSHVLLAYWAWASFVRDGEGASSMADFFPALMLADAFPFVLWALISSRVLAEALFKVLPRAQEKPSTNSADETTADQ